MALKFLLIAALASVAFVHAKPASQKVHLPVVTPFEATSPSSGISTRMEMPTSQGLDFCKTCVNFAGQALNTLLNLILNKAVSGTCGKLCGALENATHNKAIGNTCDILCELEGIKAFVNWIEHADLSPIYDCQNLGLCKYNDYGDAEIISFDVAPPAGPQGTTFEVNLAWATKNGTSTGEIRFGLSTMDHVDLDIPSAYIPDSTTAGQFTGTLNVPAKPDPNCDPSQGPCESWLYGRYNVTVLICAGECGDTKHPHAKTYATANTSFEITK